MRTSIGRLDGKVVVSEACIGSLAPYFPYDYTVIPNGIDERHFTPDADPLEHLRDGRMTYPLPRPLRSAQRPRRP